MERSAEIRQQDIHRIVLERLEGFRYRQASRDLARKRERERKLLKRPADTQQHLYENKENEMPTKERHIKVTYRATFQGLIGPMNPSRMKADAVEVPIELREASGSWIACKPGDRSKSGIFKAISAQPSAAGLKSQMSLYFRERLTDWVVWSAQDAIVPMKPEGYVVRDGRVYVIEEQTK
jgi:hypothetical protein